MKTIKIKIADFDPEAKNSFGQFFIARLSKFYKVELSDDPDYVFFYERASEQLRHPNAIRIFYTGENISPDFNVTDYSIGFDRLEFGDRHFRLPLYLVNTLYDQADIEIAGDLTFENVQPFTKEELRAKKGFCVFAYNNYLADPRRKELFEAISTYKRVNACGEYLNNMDGWLSRRLSFKREHKFSIACENSSRVGYLTEKLPVAFAARTIPIYYGDPAVGLEFNTKRFVNAHDFASFADVVERVKEIDQDDDEYLRIVNEPILAPGFHYQDTLAELEIFLRNIFDQPLDKARRRTINAAHADLLEKRDKQLVLYRQRVAIWRTLFSPLTKISFFENLKRKIRERMIHQKK